jgi:hypothetical protein
VTAGAFSGTVTQGTGAVTVTNGGTTTYLTVPNVTVAGSYFSWDTYVVPSNGNISGIGVPRIACTPGALYSQTDGAGNKWQCISQNGTGTWNGLPAPGSPNSFSIGTVTTLSPGSPATAVNVGTSGAPVINLGLPQGPQGIQGLPALLGMGFGAYSSATTYAVGDVVTYNSQSYASLVVGNVNHEPDTSPSDWGLLANLSNLPAAFAAQSAASPDAGTFSAVNGVPSVCTYSGATADVQLAAAISATPSGGTIDARCYGATTQTIAATVTYGNTYPQTILFSPATTFQPASANLTMFNPGPLASWSGLTINTTNQATYAVPAILVNGNFQQYNSFMLRDTKVTEAVANPIAGPTANLTSGSTSITVSSSTGIVTGQAVFDITSPGHLIPLSTVQSVTGTTVVLTAAPTATATGDELYFYNGSACIQFSASSSSTQSIFDAPMDNFQCNGSFGGIERVATGSGFINSNNWSNIVEQYPAIGLYDAVIGGSGSQISGDSISNISWENGPSPHYAEYTYSGSTTAGFTANTSIGISYFDSPNVDIYNVGVSNCGNLFAGLIQGGWTDQCAGGAAGANTYLNGSALTINQITGKGTASFPSVYAQNFINQVNSDVVIPYTATGNTGFPGNVVGSGSPAITTPTLSGNVTLGWWQQEPGTLTDSALPTPTTTIPLYGQSIQSLGYAGPSLTTSSYGPMFFYVLGVRAAEFTNTNAAFPGSVTATNAASAFAAGTTVGGSGVTVTSGTATAGDLACIKATGPPVVIGTCTAVSGASCTTCN